MAMSAEEKRKCRLAAVAKYNAANKDKAAAYYAANREDKTAKANARYAKNKEKVSVQWKEKYAADPELQKRNREKARGWQAANAERRREIRRKWREANPDKVRALKQARRARANLPISPAEQVEIDGMYFFCNLFPKFEVDHIIPLNGKMVSGLHVLSNLQVIERSLNRAKSNKFEVTK